MFSSTIYTLSDGTKTKNCPYFFYDRQKMVDEAKEIAKRLKFKKKLKGEDLLDVWLNDEDVKKYRKLLREIWGFAQNLYIVEEKQCCEKSDCFNTENLMNVAKYSERIDYTFHDVYCQECAEKEMKMWEGVYDVKVTPYKSSF